MASSRAPVAPAGACADALDDDLGWALGVVFRAYVKAATAVTAQLPGGPRSYQVLTAATSDQPGTQLALATRLGIDRTVMTYLLDALEDAGLVSREADPSDRRARRIVVTKRGSVLLGKLNEHLVGVETHVLAALEEDERLAFRLLLQRVATQVDALDPVVDPCALAASADGDEQAPARATRRRPRRAPPSG